MEQPLPQAQLSSPTTNYMQLQVHYIYVYNQWKRQQAVSIQKGVGIINYLRGVNIEKSEIALRIRF